MIAQRSMAVNFTAQAKNGSSRYCGEDEVDREVSEVAVPFLAD